MVWWQDKSWESLRAAAASSVHTITHSHLTIADGATTAMQFGQTYGFLAQIVCSSLIAKHRV